jgi:ABC-type glycerol-3-phosphate transport system substrate-binding protein
MYNADLFDKYGVTSPHKLWQDGKWNWDTFVSTAQEIQKKSKVIACTAGYQGYRLAQTGGEDAVAIKNGKTFYIQVKTTQVTSSSFSVTIGSKSFQRYSSNDCYYIIVARAKENKYLIFTADDIKRMISNEAISKSENKISMSFSQSDGHLYIKNEKVDYALNSFERIV